MRRLIQLHIDEACEYCQLEREEILRFVSEEWISPIGEKLFDEEDLARMRLIHELQSEFGVNDESVPIILNLVDQLNFLQREMKKLNLR